MKTGFRLIIRKTRIHMSQLIGLMLLLIVGVCFFVTLFTIVIRYEETAERFFIDHNYADVTFYGSFNSDNIDYLSLRHDIYATHGRMVRDFRENERIYRVITLTDGINTPYIYEGRLPENENEGIILKRNATALNLSVGDTVGLGDIEVIITGLAASPEYIYLVQNERTLMAQPDRFAVMYVIADFFPDGFNEIVALTATGFSVQKSSEDINAFRTILRVDQSNHYLYQSDLSEIRSFAYIFPFIFAVLIAVVIYVMLKRIIQKDRRQIGTMKALGISDSRVITIYLVEFCLTAFFGALIGLFAAMFISDTIIDIFSNMFEVPTLSFIVYPGLWVMAILVSVLLCAVSGLIALFPILYLLPANAMRPRVPKGGKRVIIEQIDFLWKRLSFNTRYSIKNTLRNKGRFFAVVLGMSGSCALLVFSMGFYNSISNTQNMFFDTFASYDVIIDFDMMPLSVCHPVSKQIEDSQKALMLPVTTQGGNYMLAIAENDFDMVNVPTEELVNGIIIPEYFADEWKISVSDSINISGFDAVVSAVIPQYLGLTLYTGFDYVNSISDEIPPVYNTLFGRSESLTALSSYLISNSIDFVTIDDDKTSFDTIMESMTVLIWFMIACSVVLGFTVLYSVGLINLSAREHEYMFMGVMGYPHKSIMLAHLKETVIQLILAIPLGFVLGNILLDSIKNEFSGNSFVIAPSIYPQSYFLSAFTVISVTTIMAIVTSLHIANLNIVEGLKAQDE